MTFLLPALLLALSSPQEQPTPPPTVVPPLPASRPKDARSTRLQGIPKKDPAKQRQPVMAKADGDFKVLRSAPCVMSLKGNLHRRMGGFVNPQDPAKTTASKTVTERFDVQMPGILEEETEKGGKVRFRFVPDPQLKEKGARGTLYMEDSQPAKGAPPAIVETTEVKRAEPFVFFAEGRGMDLLPVSGGVYYDGLMRPQGPVNAAPKDVSVRPVLSLPMPSVARLMGTEAPPALRSSSLGLWAFANARSEFTAEYTVTYNGPTDVGHVAGSVTVRFKIQPKP